MTWLNLILAILAAFRVGRIVAKDTVSQQVRGLVGKMAAGKNQYSPQWYLAELVNCQFCVGVWASAFMAILIHKKDDGLKNYLVNFLAVAGGGCALAMYLERGDHYAD